jgi:Domain of unknown function (DUF5671)
MDSQKTSPRDVFLWLSAMVTVGISVVSFVSLWFDYISRWFSETPLYDIYSGSGTRASIAALIVVFPLTVYVLHLINTDTRMYPAKRELSIRKWLIYLALFAGGVALAIDLVILITSFLSGEALTLDFIAKVATVLLVVGGSCWYFVHMLKGTWDARPTASIALGVGISLLVFSSIVGSFFVLGTPYQLRMQREDQTRIENMRDMQYRITSFYQQKGILPETSAILEDPLEGYVLPTDPKTQAKYEYTKTDTLSFQLCADFKTARELSKEDATKPVRSDDYYYQDSSSAYWSHKAERTCFIRTIDPEKYPLNNPKVGRPF